MIIAVVITPARLQPAVTPVVILEADRHGS
jgi:hypothetical protein